MVTSVVLNGSTMQYSTTAVSKIGQKASELFEIREETIALT